MKFLILCLLVAGAFAAPYRKMMRHSKGGGGIVGGTDATPGQFPYQLSFQDTTLGGKFPFCGASIYSTTWGICAAHCVTGEDFNNPVNLNMVAGEQSQSIDSGDEQRQTVTSIVQHEDYNSRTLENDISLVQFDALTFNSMVQNIPIPDSGRAFADGTMCAISGWGTLSSGGSTPDILQWVNVPVVSDADCNVYYGAGSIYDSMICAGDPDTTDSCQGDSGGPMACESVLAGIVSWGIGCASGYPGVYTETSYFNAWIVANAP